VTTFTTLVEAAMPRPTFADPKTDFAFKRIFGSEEHKDVLVAFLNNMLDLDEPHRIVTVELLPPEQRPPIAELKLSIVDVKCTDAHGVTYVVEMQVLQVEGFEKRVVYNVAKAYVNQIARGDGYPNLNDVVGITICDFVLWPDTEGRQLPMLSRWRMTEQQTGAKELGQIQLVFLELPKYDTSRPPQTVVEKWGLFLPRSRQPHGGAGGVGGASVHRCTRCSAHSGLHGWRVGRVHPRRDRDPERARRAGDCREAGP